MKLSIVITYLNRKRQLINTLESIKYFQKDYDIEIIIVDDGSTDDQTLGDLNYPATLIELFRNDFHDTVTAHSRGFREMTGDIVLINCAECMHMGDIIGYIFTNMKEKDYLNFGTYSIDYALQEKFNKLDWTSPDAVKRAHEIIEPTHSLPEKWKDGDTGWYVDKSPEHFSLLPFCAAIHRTDLEALSGFDERFGKGIGYADTDFVIRLKNLGLNAQVILDPFCVHQAHTPTIYEKTKFALNGELIASLQKDFPNRIKAEHNKIYNK